MISKNSYMKIGILTYHFGTNFGGQLQCYALMRTLENLGHKVCVINYVPFQSGESLISDIKQGLRHIKKNRSIEGLITALYSILYSNAMRKSFALYKNIFLKIGPECSLLTFSNLYKDLDAVVVGSDQVWAPAHHKSAAYFFNFTPAFKGRKIAYAPCCAINKLEDNKELITKLLSEFSSISVRNTETYNFVRSTIGITPPIVVDPTFLYEFNEFKSNVIPKTKYILTYILGEEISDGHKTVIEKIRKEYGELPVYSISLTSSKPHFFSWSDKTLWTLNPVDWVDLVRNASFLYTDSFHGCVFALKFKTPFLAYYKEEIRASRFIDLKQRYGLKNIINKVSEIDESLLSSLQPAMENYKIIQRNIDNSLAFIIDSLS